MRTMPGATNGRVNKTLASLLVAVAIASCTSDGAPAGSAAASQPTLAAASSTTTNLPDNETPASDSTPTETGQSDVPIAVVTRDGIAGWWDGSGWQSAESVAIESLPLRGGEKYQLVQVGEPTVAAVGAAPDAGCEFNDSPGIPGLIPVISDEWPASAPTAIVGVAIPIPRPVTLSSGEPENYQTAASELLAERGIIDPDPRLSQVIITDIDGDGTDEVIVTAARWKSLLPAETGDYAITFLRSVVDTEVETSVITFTSVEESDDDADPLSRAITVHEVGAVADMNGDGVMEFTIEHMYYEGAWTEIFEFTARGNAPRKVLEVGCGV